MRPLSDAQCDVSELAWRVELVKQFDDLFMETRQRPVCSEDDARVMSVSLEPLMCKRREVPNVVRHDYPSLR